MMMNKPMKIAIDLDGVLVALKAVDIASAILGHNFKEEDNQDWGFSVFPEDLRQKVFDFFSNPFVMCEHVKVIPGSQEKIREWHGKGYHMEIITARRSPIHAATVEMVKKHFHEIAKVNFVGFDESKEATLRGINPDLFVDDAPHNVTVGLDLGINTVMISNKYTAYNHHLRDRVTWVKCIKDIEI